MFFVEAEDIYDFDKILSKESSELKEFVPYEAAKQQSFTNEIHGEK
uniref:Uncharacterized protein n=1 Tax=viral metagenome TaxID=1070528 RepID=A0A6C0E1W8_9ZZZZ